MNIFPTPIHMQMLEGIDNESLSEYAYSLKNSDSGSQISNKGGWQSNTIPFNNVFNLMSEIMLHIKDYTSVLNIRKGCHINFTNQWVNINNKHSYNVPHAHNGFISGVYYVNGLGVNHGKLLLHHSDKTKTLAWHQEWFEDYNDVNCHTFEITPKSGLLVLFPSWLEHSVDRNTLNEDRVSLSFNTEIKYADY